MRRVRRIDVRGLGLVVHEWGPEDGPTVMCLHGFLDHGRSFAPVAEALSSELRVVVPDMRGHGESGWVGAGGYYHFYDYFQDVMRVLDAVRPASLTLVGHSMGGSIATGVAAMLGDGLSGLLLLEGMGPLYTRLEDTPNRLRRWCHALGQPGVNGDVEHRRAARRPMPDLSVAAERLGRANPRLSPERALQLAESFTEPGPDGVRWRYDPLHRTPSAKPFVTGEAEAMWGAVRAPTLSVFGSEGLMPEDLADRHAQVADLRAGYVAGAGHNIHHERPELVATAARWMVEEKVGLPPGLVPGTPPRPAEPRLPRH